MVFESGSVKDAKSVSGPNGEGLSSVVRRKIGKSVNRISGTEKQRSHAKRAQSEQGTQKGTVFPRRWPIGGRFLARDASRIFCSSTHEILPLLKPAITENSRSQIGRASCRK